MKIWFLSFFLWINSKIWFLFFFFLLITSKIWVLSFFPSVNHFQNRVSPFFLLWINFQNMVSFFSPCESLPNYVFFSFFSFLWITSKIWVLSFFLLWIISNVLCLILFFLTFISLQKEANKFLFLNNKIIHQHCFMRYKCSLNTQKKS